MPPNRSFLASATIWSLWIANDSSLVPGVWTCCSKMQIINDLVRSRMQAANVTFIDMVPLTADVQGGYEAYGQDANGRRVLMRKDDGMHLSLAGVMHVSGNIVDRLTRDAGLKRPQPPASQPAA